MLLFCFFFFVIAYALGLRYSNGFTNIDEIKRKIHSQYNRMIIFQEDSDIPYFLSDLGIGIYYQNPEIFSQPIINLNDIQVKYITDTLSIDFLNKNRQKDTPGKIIKGEHDFAISEHQPGNWLDLDALEKEIIAHLYDKDNLVIDLKNFYIHEEQPEYQKELDLYYASHISYTNGVHIFLSDYYEYLTVVGNQIIIEQPEAMKKAVQSYLFDALADYDTVGKEWAFQRTNGEEIIISGGNYGNIFSSEKEAAYVMSVFLKKGIEENRTPIYSQYMNEEIPDTYIEVSLEGQHAWYYHNGELLLDCDVVTGLTPKRSTPTGVYHVLEKKNGKYLTGDDYKTWVINGCV